MESSSDMFFKETIRDYGGGRPKSFIAGRKIDVVKFWNFGDGRVDEIGSFISPLVVVKSIWDDEDTNKYEGGENTVNIRQFHIGYRGRKCTHTLSATYEQHTDRSR